MINYRIKGEASGWSFDSQIKMEASLGRRFFPCEGKTVKDMHAEQRTAFERASGQGDSLFPLVWMEKIRPERWLLNGKEIRFQWTE